MLCSSLIKIWNLANHMKKPTKNIKMLNLLVKNWKLRVWCSLFHFQISICESHSIWQKFLVLSWLYIHQPTKILMLMNHCTVQSPKYSNMHVPFSIQFTVLLSFASLCSSSSHCYSKTKFEARVCICASAYNTRQQSQGSLINYVVTWRSL